MNFIDESEINNNTEVMTMLSIRFWGISSSERGLFDAGIGEHRYTAKTVTILLIRIVSLIPESYKCRTKATKIR